MPSEQLLEAPKQRLDLRCHEERGTPVVEGDIDPTANRPSNENLRGTDPARGIDDAEQGVADRRLMPVPDRRPDIRVEVNREIGAQRFGDRHEGREAGFGVASDDPGQMARVDAARATHRPQRDSRVAGQSSDLLPDGSAQVTGTASDDPWVRHEAIEARRTYAAVTWPPTADSESANRDERLDPTILLRGTQ